MGKPYIKLLETPLGKYFYDVNKNEIISVSEESYTILQSLLAADAPEHIAANAEIAFLHSRGYFSDNRVETIQHPLTDDLSYLLNRKVEKVTLQLTQQCNFRCSYCIYSDLNNEAQRSHSGEGLSLETAKHAIDFLWEHSVDTEKPNIGFYGGEPLLRFELLKQIVAYTEERFAGRPHTYTITTNGALLTDEIVDYLAEHDIPTMISLDGPKEIHDVSRRFAVNGCGSFDTVLRNIERIRERHPDYAKKISISMVMNPQHEYTCINQLFVDYDTFMDMTVSPSLIEDTYANERTIHSDLFVQQQQYASFLGYTSHLGLAKDVPEVFLTKSSVSQLAEKAKRMTPTQTLPPKTAPGGPCVPGQLRLFITVHGEFYPCERVSESSEVMNIGNLKDGFHLERARNLLNIGALTSEKCRDCWAFTSCHLCAKHADNQCELSGALKETFCEDVLANVEADLRNIILLQELSNSAILRRGRSCH